MNMMAGELLGHAANFILGICVLLGAAFVFQRSKRAALFIAIAGVSYALAVPIEVFIGRMGISMHMEPFIVNVLYMLVNMTRHVVLFGGLAMGMRTLAAESA